ncbi:MAG: nucleotidyltransferase domain-containing protein [Candidatus Hodarchaeaceae archaeon]|nr:nucleotidyltransferase domain-containing protein [Candidatus Hodarchaeaceae archaeon]
MKQSYDLMVRPVRAADILEVTYTNKRWELFKRFRQGALEIMAALDKHGIESLVHGSVARGDVDEHSDVDVFIPYVVPSYRVEHALREGGFEPSKREVVMATPWQLPKAHVYIEEDRSTTFPLVKPKQLELEFYYFGGAVNLKQVKQGVRVPGVDKRLILIEPTNKGHVEGPVVGREAEVAKLVGVGLEIVRERVQVLTRRADVGRTGIFVQRELAPDENFEAVFKELVEENPAMKLRLKEK